MKSFASLFVAFCLLFCFCIATASADMTVDNASTSGIDVVIVLDMTNSMNQRVDSGGPYDKDNYRLDAAAMLISMLDMDTSRVAVVPFADTPFNVVDLTPVSNAYTRDTLVQSIYKLKTTRPNTNIGTALMKANQILLNRSSADNSNNPMIVLLTDGGNALTAGENHQIAEFLSWNKTNNVIEVARKSNVTTEMVNDITREAVDCASYNGFPIYTIALGVDPSSAKDGALSLKAISERTGVPNGCVSLDSDHASELPEIFAKFLADQIGSSVQFSANPQATASEGSYEVKLPVLNRSVLELNVIIPVRGNAQTGIEASSIQVYDATGNLQYNNKGVTVLSNDNGHFAMVKIREPQSCGMWTLRFSSTGEPQDISFNILYNYSIKLQADVFSTSGMPDIYKTDTLDIVADFVASDGSEVNDEMLYHDYSQEAEYEPWMNIQCGWELYMAGKDDSGNIVPTGDALLSGELTADTLSKQFRGQGQLVNIKKSGEYVLQVHAQGAGLDRTVEKVITLMNHAPDAKAYTYPVHVNAINEKSGEGSWTVSSGTLPVSEFITDADGDVLTFAFEAQQDADKIIILSKDPDNAGGIRYTTVLNGDRLASGTATYTLKYSDGDDGSGEIALTFEVISDADQYTPQVEWINGVDQSGTAKKNTQITLAVCLKDKNGKNADASVLEQVSPLLEVTSANEGPIAPFGEPVLNFNSNAWEFSGSTANQSDTWTITVNVSPFEPQTLLVEIPNNSAPAAANIPVGNIIRYNGDGIPSILAGLVGENTSASDAARRIDVESMPLFADDDNDILTYEAPVVGNGLKVVSLSDSGNGYPYRLDADADEFTGLFHYDFQTEVRVEATDGDGQASTCSWTLIIENLHAKMLTYVVICALSLIALVILALIIRQIRKPCFPKLCISIREEPSYYETSTEALAPVKTPTNANQCGVEEEMANRHGLSMSQLQSIIIKPIRSTSSVGVICKKIEKDHELSLGGEILKAKKQYSWQIDEELILRNSNNENGIAMKLFDQAAESAGVDQTLLDGNGADWNDEPDTASEVEPRKIRSVKKRSVIEVQDTPADHDDFDF